MFVILYLENLCIRFVIRGVLNIIYHRADFSFLMTLPKYVGHTSVDRHRLSKTNSHRSIIIISLLNIY